MVRDKIKNAGLKATPQRVLVYEIMQELCHAPIDVIVNRVQQKSPEINVSTVYRILNSFCEAALLSKINHPDGKVYFDINTREHHHIFSDDNSIVDIVDDEVSEYLRQKFAEKLGSNEQIENISVQIVTSKNRLQTIKKLKL